ncbi:MAG TPA: zinc-binding dehydrogenase [Chloroflexota bacterium]|nr:zinc-binding dehydrogenase [Chloroflexota bacterium]
MKAARLYGVRDLRVEEVEDPRPGRGQALIRINACGVCPSDIRAYVGARAGASGLPRTPGHEWAGVIEELGPSDEPAADGQLKVGDRVAADWRYVCGRCYQCRRGVFNYCEHLERAVRGGFAQYGVAPLSQLRKIPDHVSFEQAAFCEPLACVTNGNQMTPMALGDDVVIVGAGPIGLLHLQLAKNRGARLIVSDPLPARLEVAKKLGAHDVIDASSENAVERVKELTEGRGADAVIVAVGAEEPSRQALEMAAINGRVNFFAGAYPDTSFPFGTNLVHYRQLVVTGSHDFTPHHFTTALKLISHGIVDVETLISHRFELEGVKDAFETAASRGGLKSMVLPVG